MMNMKLLVVVAPPSIYHGCSTWKTFWEEKFTGKENFTLGDFSDLKMKNCGRHNLRKYRDIKGSDKYVSLDVLLKYDSMYKTKIISSESKDNLGISRKGLITSLGLKAKARPKQYKNTRYAILNFSKKDLSKIITEFEKLPYEVYERNRSKHEPTDSYIYLSRHLAKCMVRADALNSKNCPVRTEMTAMKQIPTSQICSTDEGELKELPVDKTLSQICSTNKSEIK